MSTSPMEAPSDDDTLKKDLSCISCLSAFFIALILTIMGTGIAYMVESAQLGQIGYPYQLWYWALFYNVLMLVGIIDMVGRVCHWIRPEWTVTSVIFRPRYQIVNYVEILICAMIVEMFIWAIVIMAGLGVTSQLYSRHLWVWFQVLFWYQVFACTAFTLIMGGMFIYELINPSESTTTSTTV